MPKRMPKRRTKLSVLIALRKLLSVESRWIQRSYARGKGKKRSVSVHGSAATCWCLSGGLERVLGPFKVGNEGIKGDCMATLSAAIKREYPTLAGHGVIGFNDSQLTDYPMIRLVLRRAVTLARLSQIAGA